MNITLFHILYFKGNRCFLQIINYSIQHEQMHLLTCARWYETGRTLCTHVEHICIYDCGVFRTQIMTICVEETEIYVFCILDEW